MSASEKLKALDELIRPWHPPPEDVLGKLPKAEQATYRALTALPQIVAVVDAAERIALSDYRSGQVYATKTDQDMLDAALAALDEALGDVT